MKPLLIALAIYNGANGMLMLAVPRFWYANVPGASDTGPFNAHFIPDIAFGFLAAALGLWLAAFASGKQRLYALAAPALFLGGHALLHVYEWTRHADLLLFETATIVVPGFLPAFFAFSLLGKERR